MLDIKVCAQAGAEEEDKEDGAVDPDLGAFGDAEGREVVGEEVVG